MKKILPLIVLFFVQTCIGQSDSLFNNKLLVKITPLSFIDFYGGTSWRAGLEYRIWRNWAACLDYGTYFSYSKKDDYISKTNTTGYFIRPEIKLYLNKPCSYDKRERNYLALEYLYKNTTFNFTDSIRMDQATVYSKTYSIFKEISAVTFKYGTVKNITSRIIIEGYAGAGARFSRGYNTLTAEETSHVLTGENHGPMFGEAIRDYHVRTINLIAGFSVGYRLK